MADVLESGQMYLETILILSREKDCVRSVDVAAYMGFSKPSVSRAMGLLRHAGMILTDESGSITLTEEGRCVAEKVYERHVMLTDFLILLGVSEETASFDACKMEHDISDETFAAIRRHALTHCGKK